MNQIEKKSRFINFIIKAVKFNNQLIFKNSQYIKQLKYPIIFKLRIRDIKATIFIIFEQNSINIVTDSKIKRKANCFITINRAKTLHNLLRGKILITDITLIGKLAINSCNRKYINLFYILITSLRKGYKEIIKGTRFTLIGENY